MAVTAERFVLGGSAGNWSVIDTRTGGPAIVDGFVQIGFLDMDEADDLVDLLNQQELARRSKLRLVVPEAP